MIKFINEHLISYGLNEKWAFTMSNIIMIVIIFILCILSYLIASKILLKILKAFAARSKSQWDDIMIRNKVFERLVLLVPALVIQFFAHVFPTDRVLFHRLVSCYIIFVVLLVLDKFFDGVNDIYQRFEVSKIRPIKGYLQVLKIVSYVVGIIIMIGILINRSPWFLLSGIGAATAVLLLIFQNSILGLVAGIQLSANDMLQIGDWIEMPKYDANGDVVEISLHTVKVKNWDKTITTIPTHALISESFKNWRGMLESGGRRIKRAIYIDATSVKFCDDEMLERYSKIQYIRPYIDEKKKELKEYNEMHHVDLESSVNGRHMTNIGTFRVYLMNYLKNHPGIHSSMIQLVRQLEPGENGVPIEIYAFTNSTAWVIYEGIQSDIFDHIFAIIPEFDLRIFQSPAGHDLKNVQRFMN